MRGVLEPLPREPAEASFNDYLENLGIRQKLTRAQIIREEQAAGFRFQRFCARAENRLEDILGCGLERHPEVLSLYLAMLLGENAVLSPRAAKCVYAQRDISYFFDQRPACWRYRPGAAQALLPPAPRAAAAGGGLSLLLLWFYVQITGASSPAERSFLMIAFLLGSQVFRLPGNGLAALAAAALVALLLDPLQLFSTGFQMSYNVVTALVVMGVPLTEKWLAAWQPFILLPKPNWRWYHRAFSWTSRWLVGSSAACWVAFLASTPSGIGYFHLFSPGSLVANLIIIPLSSLAIIAGFLSLLTGLRGVLSLSALFNSAAAVTIIVMDWLAQHGITSARDSISPRTSRRGRGWRGPALARLDDRRDAGRPRRALVAPALRRLLAADLLALIIFGVCSLSRFRASGWKPLIDNECRFVGLRAVRCGRFSVSSAHSVVTPHS